MKNQLEFKELMVDAFLAETSDGRFYAVMRNKDYDDGTQCWTATREMKLTYIGAITKEEAMAVCEKWEEARQEWLVETKIVETP